MSDTQTFQVDFKSVGFYALSIFLIICSLFFGFANQDWRCTVFGQGGDKCKIPNWGFVILSVGLFVFSIFAFRQFKVQDL